MGRTVTIKEVAQKAGVSPSTVSRVIKGNSRISQRTINKVQQVMEELNYVPNYAAQSLITKQTKKIGLILKGADELTRLNPFYINVLFGISLQCNELGYATQTTISNHSDDLYQEVYLMIKQHMVDGFILLYSKHDDPIKQLLIDENIPFVVIGKPITDRDTQYIHIDNDNVTASKQLTEHVIQQGANYITFITDKQDYEVSKDRTQGFIETVQAFQIPYDIIEVDFNTQSFADNLSYEVIAQKLKHYRYAIITVDAMLHLPILNLLYDFNLHIPYDVMTATFNDSYLTAYATPAQSCIDILPQTLGQQAGQAILKIIQEVESHSETYILVETQLKIRQSTLIKET